MHNMKQAGRGRAMASKRARERSKQSKQARAEAGKEHKHSGSKLVPGRGNGWTDRSAKEMLESAHCGKAGGL